MLDAGCQPSSIILNSLMRIHAKAGRTGKVLQLYNQMKRLGCEPDMITYNLLLESHCKDENERMNASTFNTLILCVAKFGNVKAVRRINEIMKEFKYDPNPVTYNTLMKLHVALKSTGMVLKLKKEMDENKPNVNTYNVLITMYCEMENWNDAYELFREMIEEKCLKPSMPVYVMVLHQLRKAGELKKHENWRQRWWIEDLLAELGDSFCGLTFLIEICRHA
ncbi:unnamed protein product [Dovyalis caffra]|uniref:Pentatricopeptide repeat-containing protein n=1 Tax=Dovyalis caffra TaxID=77055 RepID=A0AAV1S6Z3_9ROSI|nr:unnamed protein product [Dovyalis caffra]